MRDQPPETAYRITIRFAPRGVPAIIRLRKFLKFAWRAYGLQAVRVEEVSPASTENSPAKAFQGQGVAESPETDLDPPERE